MYQNIRQLEDALMNAEQGKGDELRTAIYYRNIVLPAMNELRITADEIENMMDRKHYPYPGYGKLLFGVL